MFATLWLTARLLERVDGTRIVVTFLIGWGLWFGSPRLLEIQKNRIERIIGFYLVSILAWKAMAERTILISRVFVV
jgi:hypothetical protein